MGVNWNIWLTGRVWPRGKIMGPKRWHTQSQSPGRVPRFSSPRSSATWSRSPYHDVGVFGPQERAEERGFCHSYTRLFHQSAIPITGVLITPTWPSFTNHQHHSIRARSSHKHIVWSPLWKRTQIICQATYLNSISKFPDHLRLLLVFLCICYSYLPASNSRYQLLETHSVIPQSLKTW